MSYLHSYSTISKASTHTQSLLKGINEGLDFSQNVEPAYKEKINPMAVRRMSRIVKMGVYTALEAIGEKNISGIVHATGLGCLADTQRFLDAFAPQDDVTLSPTAFIQSTHNTIAGQIALLLKIQQYNMTHVQNGVSFESALVDALCLCEEEQTPVLVGGADESAPILNNIMQYYALAENEFSYGASSFLIGAQTGDLPLKISSCNIRSIKEKISLPSADLVLYGKSFFKANLTGIIGVNYTTFSGVFNTNSAFALQLAAEILLADLADVKVLGLKAIPKSISIVNNFNDLRQGSVVLQKI